MARRSRCVRPYGGGRAVISVLKRERRFSLPTIQLPRPSPEWLLIPAVLLGLLVLWYGWVALWNCLTTLFP